METFGKIAGDLATGVASSLLYDLMKSYATNHSFPDAQIKVGAMLGVCTDVELISEKKVQEVFDTATKKLEMSYKTPNIFAYKLSDGSDVYVDLGTVSTIDDVSPEDIEFTFTSAPIIASKKEMPINEVEIMPLVTSISLKMYLDKPKTLESLDCAFECLKSIMKQFEKLPHTTMMKILYLYVDTDQLEKTRRILAKMESDGLVFLDFNDVYENSGFEVRDIDELKIKLLIKNLKGGFLRR